MSKLREKEVIKHCAREIVLPVIPYEMHMKRMWNAGETNEMLMKHRWNAGETIMKRRWNANETQVKR